SLNWPVDRLAEIAGEIGSDIPFFLYGGTAVCRGRGERVQKLPAISPIHFVVAKPPVGLSTGDVYGARDRISKVSGGEIKSGGSLAGVVRDMQLGGIANWARQMQNGLQQAASSLSPWFERLKAAFDSLDFAGHQLSGSGTAYFGVCRHAQHARRLA